MNPIWFIVGTIGGLMLARLRVSMLHTEWRPRRCRCQPGKPCGRQAVRNGFGIYRYCDDTQAKEGKQP